MTTIEEEEGSIFSWENPDDKPSWFDNAMKKNNETFENKLTIKYLACSLDDKNFNLTFEVSAKNLKSNKAKIYVGESEVFGNEIAVPLKSIEINANGKKKIMVSFSKDKEFSATWFEGDFEYIAEISCDGLSAATLEFKLKCDKAKNKVCNLTEPKAVYSIKLTLTEEQKSKFIATIYGEASTAENQFEPFCWVYFNLVSSQGFEKGMNNSYAYKDKNYLYKDALKNYTTGKIPSVNKIKEIVENKILADKPLNPYPEWEGQGYYGDMNIRVPKPSYRRVWAYASQYFHLQNKCKVKEVLVKEFKAIKNTSKGPVDITGYIYNFTEIEKYFKSHPKDLPDYELGECKYDKLSPTQINSIPAIHKVESCQTNK